MLIVACTAAGPTPSARAASGNAGTNMCMARVPLRVMSTSSHSGGAPAEGEGDARIAED